MGDGTPRNESDDITQLLDRWREGDEDALGELLPQVYTELRRVAGAAFGRERADHTLQPTAVLHEAYIRLVGPGASFENRAHFFAAAAHAIRRVLVEHARRRQAGKRPSSGERVTLIDSPVAETTPRVDVLALHQALERLENVDPRKARIVELRSFGGLTETEIAQAEDISRTTVSREWRLARLLLSSWLTPPPGTR